MPQQTSLWSNATHLNSELTTLVEDEDSFKDSVPLLFGKGFDQKARDHMEAIKSLKKTSFPASQPFQKSHSPQSHSQGQRDKEIQQSSQDKGKNLMTLSCVIQTNLLKILNSMNCHCTNKLQNKAPTTELVTNTKVSNPVITNVKKICNGSEYPHTYKVSESTLTMPVQETVLGHQNTILSLPYPSPDTVPDKSPWIQLMKMGIVPFAAELCSNESSYSNRIGKP